MAYVVEVASTKLKFRDSINQLVTKAMKKVAPKNDRLVKTF